MVGIDITKETVKVICDLSVYAIGVVKRGFSISDILGISKKIADFKKVMTYFPKNMEEMKDLDAQEAQELAKLVLECVLKVVTEFQKK